MKLTLLQLTQSILSSLNSDEVNSISDTTESLQVAEIIRTTYFNIIARAGLTNQHKLFQLIPSTDTDLPVLMYKPDNIAKIDWIKYKRELDDGTFTFQPIQIIPIDEFISVVNGYNPNLDNVVEYTFTEAGNNFSFLYRNDGQPCYCTVIENHYILFDSYDSTIDSTLVGSKTICHGETVATFTMSDLFIPELDDYQFPLLLNEAKALAFVELKQSQHPKAEQESKRQWSTLQKHKATVDVPSDFDALPNYGRKRYFR